MEREEILLIKQVLNKLLLKVSELQKAKINGDAEKFNILKKECLSLQDKLDKIIK